MLALTLAVLTQNNIQYLHKEHVRQLRHVEVGYVFLFNPRRKNHTGIRHTAVVSKVHLLPNPFNWQAGLC